MRGYPNGCTLPKQSYLHTIVLLLQTTATSLRCGVRPANHQVTRPPATAAQSDSKGENLTTALQPYAKTVSFYPVESDLLAPPAKLGNAQQAVTSDTKFSLVIQSAMSMALCRLGASFEKCTEELQNPQISLMCFDLPRRLVRFLSTQSQDKQYSPVQWQYDPFLHHRLTDRVLIVPARISRGSKGIFPAIHFVVETVYP